MKTTDVIFCVEKKKMESIWNAIVAEILDQASKLVNSPIKQAKAPTVPLGEPAKFKAHEVIYDSSIRHQSGHHSQSILHHTPSLTQER